MLGRVCLAGRLAEPINNRSVQGSGGYDNIRQGKFLLSKKLLLFIKNHGSCNKKNTASKGAFLTVTWVLNDNRIISMFSF